VTLLGYSAGASVARVESVLGRGSAALITVNAVSAGAARQVADSIRRLGAKVVLVDGEFITSDAASRRPSGPSLRGTSA
jgi:hypothetical protein